MRIVQLTIDVDSDLLERMDDVANFQEKQLNDMILECMEDYVELQERYEESFRQNMNNESLGDRINRCARLIPFPQR